MSDAGNSCADCTFCAGQGWGTIGCGGGGVRSAGAGRPERGQGWDTMERGEGGLDPRACILNLVGSF